MTFDAKPRPSRRVRTEHSRFHWAPSRSADREGGGPCLRWEAVLHVIESSAVANLATGGQGSTETDRLHGDWQNGGGGRTRMAVWRQASLRSDVSAGHAVAEAEGTLSEPEYPGPAVWVDGRDWVMSLDDRSGQSIDRRVGWRRVSIV